MELYGEEWFVLAVVSFITDIVRISEELLPALRQHLSVHLITVVLAGDVTAAAHRVCARDIVTMELQVHLRRCRSCRF